MQAVLKFFQDNPTFFIATVEGDQPRVRPFGAVAEFEGKLYLCTNNQKQVFKQIQANPKIEICGFDQKERWLRVAAKVVVDSRKEAKEKMLADNPGLKKIYSTDDGIFEVFYLSEATASFSSFTGESRTVTF